jgi:hypothetical protein
MDVSKLAKWALLVVVVVVNSKVVVKMKIISRLIYCIKQGKSNSQAGCTELIDSIPRMID